MRDVRRVGPYRVVPFAPERNATVDTLRWAKKRLHIPILVEVEIGEAREAIRAYRRRTRRALSLTAWIVRCVARAAAEHPRVHAVRAGRRRLVLFDEVDVAVLVERAVASDAGDETLPMPYVVRQANRKTAPAIDEEIRAARAAPLADGTSAIAGGPSAGLQRLFFRLPAWARDVLFWRWLLRSPTLIRRTMGTVVVTATGMAAPGVLAWGIPAALHPLAIGVGGIARRGSDAETREYLALTVVFDHEVTDGAPVGRFVRRMIDLAATRHGLAELDDTELDEL